MLTKEKISTSICCFHCPDPKIDAEGTDEPYKSSTLGNSFKPEYVLKNDCKENDRGSLYWIAPNNLKNRKIVIDLGCTKKVKGVKLRNTNSGMWKDRATKGYSVEVSEDKKRWKEVLSGELEDSRKKKCNKIPVHEKTFSPTMGRYVRFTMKDFYGFGGGLQYFKAIVDDGENK